VSLSVCVCTRIGLSRKPHFTKFLTRVACGHASVFFAGIAMLFISGCIYDVMLIALFGALSRVVGLRRAYNSVPRRHKSPQNSNRKSYLASRMQQSAWRRAVCLDLLKTKKPAMAILSETKHFRATSTVENCLQYHSSHLICTELTAVNAS